MNKQQQEEEIKRGCCECDGCKSHTFHFLLSCGNGKIFICKECQEKICEECFDQIKDKKCPNCQYFLE